RVKVKPIVTTADKTLKLTSTEANILTINTKELQTNQTTHAGDIVKNFEFKKQLHNSMKLKNHVIGAVPSRYEKSATEARSAATMTEDILTPGSTLRSYIKILLHFFPSLFALHVGRIELQLSAHLAKRISREKLNMLPPNYVI